MLVLFIDFDAIRVAAAKLAAARGDEFKTKDGLPGRKWWKHFKARHPTLVTRRHKRLQPGLPTREQLTKWFDGLRDLMVQHNVTEDRIWNCDETGIDGRYGKKARVVTVEGIEPCVVGPTWRGHFTCVVCVCVPMGSTFRPCGLPKVEGLCREIVPEK